MSRFLGQLGAAGPGDSVLGAGSKGGGVGSPAAAGGFLSHVWLHGEAGRRAEQCLHPRCRRASQRVCSLQTGGSRMVRDHSPSTRKGLEEEQRWSQDTEASSDRAHFGPNQ